LKYLGPSENSSPHLVSQIRYGPANHALLYPCR